MHIWLNSNDVWIGLSYVGFGVFCIVFFVEIGRVMASAGDFGREILGILGSRHMVESKVFAYEVNSIWHRTNFA